MLTNLMQVSGFKSCFTSSLNYNDGEYIKGPILCKINCFEVLSMF